MSQPPEFQEPTMMSVVQMFQNHSLTQTIYKMTQFKMPSETYD